MSAQHYLATIFGRCEDDLDIIPWAVDITQHKLCGLFGRSLLTEAECNKLLEYVPETGLCAFIGFRTGVTAAYVAEARPCASIVCVDLLHHAADKLYMFANKRANMTVIAGTSQCLSQLNCYNSVNTCLVMSEPAAHWPDTDLRVAKRILVNNGTLVVLCPTDEKLICSAVESFVGKSHFGIIEKYGRLVFLRRTDYKLTESLTQNNIDVPYRILHEHAYEDLDYPCGCLFGRCIACGVVQNITRCNEHMDYPGDTVSADRNGSIIDGIPQNADFCRQFAEATTALNAEIPVVASGNVLDINAGIGHLAPLFRHRGYTYDAIVTDSWAQDYIQKAHMANATHIEFEHFEPKTRYNVVLFNSGLEEAQDAGKMLAKAVGLLKPSGRIYVLVPCGTAVYNLRQRWFFTEETVRGWMVELGLENVASVVFPGFIPQLFASGQINAKLCTAE